MNLPKISRKVAAGLAGLVLAGSALASPTYLFKIYSQGLCANNSCAAATGPDPDKANVVALLHMDGTNGSTIFTDQIGSTFSDYGSATLSTAQSMFGGSSALFNGSNYIQTPASSKWSLTGDFTIEGFVNFSVLSATSSSYSPSNQYLFDFGANGTFFRYMGVAWSTNPAGWAFYGPGQVLILNYASTAVTNHWYYWVVQRKGTAVSLFLDGTQVATGTYAGTLGGATGTLTFGDYGGGSAYGLQGYLDEIRVTNGVARYSTSAPVPSAEFSNN